MKKFILKEEQIKRVIKKLNEDNISELTAFEQRIYDVVMDFIGETGGETTGFFSDNGTGYYGDEDDPYYEEENNHSNYLTINKQNLAVSVGAKSGDENDYYLIDDYINVEDTEDGSELYPNVDAISELASGYIFVR
jgi:hypothetical protein